MNEPGVPQSRDDLTRYVCGRDWTAGDRTVDVLVARLRRRIPPGTAKIVTIHRFGYVLNRVD
ncbi:winged helix-turn-helix domain-containing protein [Roseibium album]|uniref:winged helix-turn-helix domain-containing protein n=1 Tax=Roseibium album TaxID=311410 RepID=UPI0009E9224C|nr:winged helix-turn-helix domain-containing protein [Roseibium album]